MAPVDGSGEKSTPCSNDERHNAALPPSLSSLIPAPEIKLQVTHPYLLIKQRYQLLSTYVQSATDQAKSQLDSDDLFDYAKGLFEFENISIHMVRAIRLCRMCRGSSVFSLRNGQRRGVFIKRTRGRMRS
jgi:hypothetical protein